MTTEQNYLGREVGRRAVLGGIAGAAAVTGLGLLGTPVAQALGPADAVASAVRAAKAKAKVAAAGATTPFVTIGAETGTLGGGARVRAFTVGTPVGTVATLESEASGYALVELRAVGDSVTITNSTGVTANTIVVRASLPDAPTGGGITATLNLYVNGQFRQALTLSSAQAWIYRGSTTSVKDPNGGGVAHHFYNEFPFWVQGAPIAPGSTITLRKDAANTASAYHIDCIDLEKVAPPRQRPANSLSVIDYGADPNFGTDSTIAIQNAVNAARGTGRSVWIPAGKYLTNSLVPTPLDLTGVTVNGAGMWHTIIYRRPPLPSPANWRSQTIVGSGTTLTDVQIDSNAIFRGEARIGGADYSLNAGGSAGWLIDRVWTRHCEANWLSGSNATVQNSRTADSYGDGFNINNSNTSNPEKRGHDMLVRNCFARGTGDDGFAVYSDAGTAGASPQVERVRFINNTSVAVWWANGIRVAGGKDIEVRDNLVDSVSSNSAMHIGVFGDTGNPLESATVVGNLLIGGGGWNGDRHGVQIGSTSPTSLFPGVASHVTLSDNVMRGALRSGLYVDRYTNDVIATNNTVDGPAAQGIRIRSEVSGTGRFTSNQVQNLRAGQVPFQNDSAATFATVLEDNSWQ